MEIRTIRTFAKGKRRVTIIFYAIFFVSVKWKLLKGDNIMSKKNFKEDFEDGFKKGASFFGIHSVGDFFRVSFNAALGFIKAIFKFMT